MMGVAKRGEEMMLGKLDLLELLPTTRGVGVRDGNLTCGREAPLLYSRSILGTGGYYLLRL